jgi:hypothetical protein
MLGFFKEIRTFWLETWQQSKTLFFAEMVGTISGMIGAGTLTFMAPNPNLLLSFSAYIISSLALLYVCHIRKSSWMMMLMVFYTFTTAVGLGKLFI